VPEIAMENVQVIGNGHSIPQLLVADNIRPTQVVSYPTCVRSIYALVLGTDSQTLLISFCRDVIAIVEPEPADTHQGAGIAHGMI
jgi:hypothetical protein